MLSLSPVTLSPKPLSPILKSSFTSTQIRPPCMVVPVRRAAQGFRASSIVMMSKRAEELKEIREMTTEQINEEVIDLKGEILTLRLRRSAREDFKPSEFGRMRKRIARMLTVKREREIEEGINKRLSRKLDRQWKKNIVPRPPPSLKKNEGGRGS